MFSCLVAVPVLVTTVMMTTVIVLSGSYGRDKTITDVVLKFELIDQLTQLKVCKLLTFDLCPELDLLI